MDRAIELFQKMHPQHFEGTTDPIVAENWLEKMEKVFDGMRCPNDRKVSLVVTVLDGEGNDWWKHYRRIHFRDRPVEAISWEEFVKAFRQKYVPHSARIKMRVELERLVQRNMTVPEYEAKFTSLSKFVPQLVSTEEDNCYMFQKGLRDSIRAAVILTLARDYSQLVEVATLIEQDQQVNL
ncbi:hypothetical protein AXF42_Ash001627 [Apostasia shenzhenica]|uniref:Retrotransposon gag domain-containing protein n=1 Tax=Apostasia shenzhenica TaxID=1088818 RepID=A0A2I0AAV5_9ASPA|nr:hypothetical protein AXF42_Ash001627 [Apostasia shenzhenica]